MDILIIILWIWRIIHGLLGLGHLSKAFPPFLTHLNFKRSPKTLESIKIKNKKICSVSTRSRRPYAATPTVSFPSPPSSYINFISHLRSFSSLFSPRKFLISSAHPSRSTPFSSPFFRALDDRVFPDRMKKIRVYRRLNLHISHETL